MNTEPRTHWRHHMPPIQLFAYRFYVWKVRPIIGRWEPISRDD